MMRWMMLFLLTMSIVFLNPELVECQDEKIETVRPSELRDVPVGVVLRPKTAKGYQTVFKPKEEYKCFTATEWSSMGFLITDYRWFFHYSIKLGEQLKLRQEQIDNRSSQILDLRREIKLLTDSQKFIQQMLNQEHAMLLQERSNRKKAARSSKIITGLHWGVHGVQLLINGVLIVMLATK